MAWLMIGIVVLNIMSGAFLGDSAWLVESRSRGILQRVHASPLPPLVLLGAYVVARLIVALGQSALIVAVAVLGFGAQFSWGGLALGLPLLITGALIFLALGQALGAAALTAAPANQALWLNLAGLLIYGLLGLLLAARFFHWEPAR